MLSPASAGLGSSFGRARGAPISLPPDLPAKKICSAVIDFGPRLRIKKVKAEKT
jgi:hypothetical protein